MMIVCVYIPFMRVVDRFNVRRLLSPPGEGSCRLDSLNSLVFEPGLGGSDSKCPCNTIDR